MGTLTRALISRADSRSVDGAERWLERFISILRPYAFVVIMTDQAANRQERKQESVTRKGAKPSLK
jgi:hypothetical protein